MAPKKRAGTRRRVALQALALVLAAALGAMLAWNAPSIVAFFEGLRSNAEPVPVASAQEDVAGQGAAGQPTADATASEGPRGASDDIEIEVAVPSEVATTARSFPNPTVWNEDDAPDYWRVVGPAVVDLSIPAGEVRYQPLDELGRATRAVGTVTYETMRAGIERERGNLQGVEPSGWGHNAEVDIVQPNGKEYHGYLWNRSHLVAKSLGGSDDLENLVCGTRMQNIGSNDGQGGMGYPERLARTWLESHPEGTLFYSATPLYVGDELVCRSVLVDLRSSDGELDLELEVYNAAAGYVIDYATGEFSQEP